MRLALFFALAALLAAASTSMAMPALISCDAFPKNVPGEMHILRRIACSPSKSPTQTLQRRLGFGDTKALMKPYEDAQKDKEQQQQQEQQQTDALNKIAANGGDITCTNSKGKRDNNCNFSSGNINTKRQAEPLHRRLGFGDTKALMKPYDDAQKDKEQQQQQEQQQTDALNKIAANGGDVTCKNVNGKRDNNCNFGSGDINSGN